MHYIKIQRKIKYKSICNINKYKFCYRLESFKYPGINQK